MQTVRHNTNFKISVSNCRKKIKWIVDKYKWVIDTAASLAIFLWGSWMRAFLSETLKYVCAYLLMWICKCSYFFIIIIRLLLLIHTYMWKREEESENSYSNNKHFCDEEHLLNWYEVYTLRVYMYKEFYLIFFSVLSIYFYKYTCLLYIQQ